MTEARGEFVCKMTHVVWVTNDLLSFRIEVAQQQNLAREAIGCSLLQVANVLPVHPKDVIVLAEILLFNLKPVIRMQGQSRPRNRWLGVYLSGAIVVFQIVIFHCLRCSAVGRIACVPPTNSSTVDIPLGCLTSLLHFVDEHRFGNGRTADVPYKIISSSYDSL